MSHSLDEAFFHLHTCKGILPCSQVATQGGEWQAMGQQRGATMNSSLSGLVFAGL